MAATRRRKIHPRARRRTPSAIQRTSAAARRARNRLARTWKDTRGALTTAEARVQKQLEALARRAGVDPREVRARLKEWNARFERERRRAKREFESRLAELQTRARRERRMIGRLVDDGVQGALASLNIPSRREVHELTRKVDELSRKIDRFRR